MLEPEKIREAGLETERRKAEMFRAIALFFNQLTALGAVITEVAALHRVEEQEARTKRKARE